MPLCESLTLKGSTCRRYACKNDTMCYSHSKNNKKEIKIEVSCLFKSCLANPIIDTPNGKCCDEHHGIYKLKRPDECPICMDSLQENDSPFACGHWMHKACFLECKKLSCPICRATVRLPQFEYLQWKEKHGRNNNVQVDNRNEEDQTRFNIFGGRLITPLDLINLMSHQYATPTPFNIYNIPFENIRELITFDGFIFNTDELRQTTMNISTVYNELNNNPIPEMHVMLALNRNGYTYSR